MSRIVLFGATGYTGRLTAEALVRRGARPVLAGRNRESLDRLAESLGGLDVAVADVATPETVDALAADGGVLVSTVGPFTSWGEPAVRAAIAGGATYLDSTGEPPFVRRVFDEWGPLAEQRGTALLTAFGYDYVPGNLAAALALEEAGPTATRVDVGYFFTGKGRPSGGTVASMALIAGSRHPNYRDGVVVDERPAKSVRSFRVRGRDRQAISIGGTEHFALPREYPRLRDVNVFLGWFGPMSRVMQAGSALASVLPGGASAPKLLSRVLPTPAPGTGPSAEARARSGSYVVGVAYDSTGRALSRVDLAGADGYDFTAEILAWGAIEAAAGRVTGAGALGPVSAYGLDALRAGVESAGLLRVERASAAQ